MNQQTRFEVIFKHRSNKHSNLITYLDLQVAHQAAIDQEFEPKTLNTKEAASEINYILC